MLAKFAKFSRSSSQLVQNLRPQRISNYQSLSKIGHPSLRYFSDVQTPVNPEIEDKIMEIIRSALEKSPKAKPDLLDRERSFEDMGLDSLDQVDLIVEQEDTLGVDITNEEAEDQIKTPKDAVKVFSTYLQK